MVHSKELAEKLFKAEFALIAILQILRDASFLDIETNFLYSDVTSLVKALVAEKAKPENIRIQ